MKLLCLAVMITVLSAVAAAPTSGLDGCPSSGNAAVLSKSTPAATYTIQAPNTNSGNIVWGGPTITTATGTILYPGSSYTPPGQGGTSVYDLGKVFFACTNNGDHLAYTYQ